MKVKLFRPRRFGIPTSRVMECLASGGNSGCLQSKGPGCHRHRHDPPFGLGGVVSSPKNRWVSNRNRPLFPGDPESFQGRTCWLLVSGRVKLRKKNVFWVRPHHLKVCVIFPKLLSKCSFFWGALLVTPCYLIIRNVGPLFW